MDVLVARGDEVQVIQHRRQEQVLLQVVCSLFQTFEILHSLASPPAK
jgi:hypothetical protein